MSRDLFDGVWVIKPHQTDVNSKVMIHPSCWQLFSQQVQRQQGAENSQAQLSGCSRFHQQREAGVCSSDMMSAPGHQCFWSRSKTMGDHICLHLQECQPCTDSQVTSELLKASTGRCAAELEDPQLPAMRPAAARILFSPGGSDGYVPF